MIGFGEYPFGEQSFGAALPDAYRPPTLTWTVRINGVVTPVRSIRTTHDVDRPVGTATVTLRAPKPVSAEIGSRVTIHAGYDGAALPIFNGRVVDYDGQFDEGGGEVRINIDGNGSALMDKHEVILGVQGPIRWFSWWRSVCDYVGVPNYWADEVEDVDGVMLYRGDNSAIRSGLVLIGKDRAPGQEMARTARLVGFRHYETPTSVRLSRVSGLPTKPLSELDTFAEGTNCRSVQRGESISDIANYWDVYGATYTATDGSEVALRSFPAVVTPNPLFGPNGIRHEEIRDAALDTIDLATASRNAHEVDYTEPSSVWTWQTKGRPDIYPGEQVALQSAKVGPQVVVTGSVVSFPVALWVMSVVHSISEAGWTTTMTGWSGAGTPLPTGSDCTTISLLGSTGRHLGDETLSHYRRPTPDGTTVTFPFTVPNVYTTLTLFCEAHGTNSYLTNTETNVSRFEIWQGGERATEQGELPFLPENLSQALPYSQDTHWSPVVIPLKGSLNAGSAELRIISGTDTGFDDFECKNIRIRLCGVGAPAIVGSYTP